MNQIEKSHRFESAALIQSSESDYSLAAEWRLQHFSHSLDMRLKAYDLWCIIFR